MPHWPRPPRAAAGLAGPPFKLWLRGSAVSALDVYDRDGLTADLCRPGSDMKRSHTYSSSDSELDDNVDVEKDSGDENRCVSSSSHATDARFHGRPAAESIAFFALTYCCFALQSA